MPLRKNRAAQILPNYEKKIKKKVKKIFFVRIDQNERDCKSEYYNRKLIVRKLTKMDWKCRVNLEELSPKLIDLVGQIYALGVNPEVLSQIFSLKKSYNTIGSQYEENFAEDLMAFDGESGENLLSG